MGIFDNPAAFAAFHDEVISYRGERSVGGAARTVRGTVRACIVENDFDDPISDGAVASERRRVMIRIPIRGEGAWPETTPPRIGDTFTRPTPAGDLVYGATNVGLDVDGNEYLVEARG